MDGINWDKPLTKRSGGASRLGGIDVYYDFDWPEVFRHNRAMFQGGLSLSRMAQDECPDGKRPALLLTEQDEVELRVLATPEKNILVIPIHEYLRSAGADRASAFYAQHCGTSITQLPSLSQTAFVPEELDDFLDSHLSKDILARWAARSPLRRGVIRELADGGDLVCAADLTEALRRLATVDPCIVDEVAECISGFGEDAVRDILRRLTDSPGGRGAATDTLAGRLVERIADTRAKLSEFQQLVAAEGVTETTVQAFLEGNPWIVGLPYVRARGRVPIPRGEIDFVLDRFDGFFDIVELKSPDDPIIVERGGGDGSRRPSASSYSLGPGLAKALTQAHLYKSTLERGRGLERDYGLTDSRQPKILVLVGTTSKLNETTREILRQLNLSLHRVEVIPYDVLGRRTTGLLDNIQALWSGAAEHDA